jgi:hypothetical protein
MSGIAFQNVAGLKPGRTRFDWHTTKKFDADFGLLYPIFVKDCLPGDYWSINMENLIRCTPLVHPTMHEISIDTHYFFIPYRIMDDCNSRPNTGNPSGDPIMLKDDPPPANRFNWELYITGGVDGMDAQECPQWNPSSTWAPTGGTNNAPYKFSLWDYMDLPILTQPQQWNSSATPFDFLRRAYNFIWNEYYRDETLQNLVSWRNERLLTRNWRKDYFTSALPFQQRGIAPAFPVHVDFSNLPFGFGIEALNESIRTTQSFGMSNLTNTPLGWAGNSPVPGAHNAIGGNIFNQTGADGWRDFYLGISRNQLDAQFNSALSTFDVADLRLAVQLQKVLERMARSGARYPEFLKAVFNQDMGDHSLWRPQYIGGSKTPMILSEVLQTSESNDTPQGNMSGHGISISGSHIGTHHCNDYGIIIGLMSVMPAPAYHQGIDRTWQKKIRDQWFRPEYVNLSEQAIEQSEIYINNNTTDAAGWGYQGMYDEYRKQHSTFNGNFRDTLLDWHMGRIFSNTPLLNSDFIRVDPIAQRRIFMVQSDPVLLCDIEHTFYAVRPIPEMAEPGLLDHH